MTKPMNPEIKQMRAIHRALGELDAEARRRVLVYFTAREYGVTQAEIHVSPYVRAASDPQGETPR